MKSWLDNDRDLVIAGSVLMAIGVFLPILSVPIIGTLTYIHDGTGDGIFVLAAAVIAAALALWGKPRFAVFPAAGAAALMIFTYFRFRQMMTDMKAQMETDLGDSPFRGLAEAALESTQMQWGWIVLAAGAAITLFASTRAWMRMRRGG